MDPIPTTTVSRETVPYTSTHARQGAGTVTSFLVHVLALPA